MLQTKNGDRRIAMLIDGDNAKPSVIKLMLVEAGRFGLVTNRRIYGDWTTSNMNGWKETLHTHAFQAIQQFRYTIRKNATDSAMIIDAMDILYSGAVNGFCIVSSDSDYTRLATRVREQGLFIMGIGEKKTPRSFVNACEVFVYTENLASVDDEPRDLHGVTEAVSASPDEVNPIPLLKSAVETTTHDEDWAFLGTVGNRLRQLDPGFDPRSYGYRQLSTLIRHYAHVFEMNDVKSPNGPSQIYVRLKE